jgi:hypothetical protein
MLRAYQELSRKLLPRLGGLQDERLRNKYRNEINKNLADLQLKAIRSRLMHAIASRDLPEANRQYKAAMSIIQQYPNRSDLGPEIARITEAHAILQAREANMNLLKSIASGRSPSELLGEAAKNQQALDFLLNGGEPVQVYDFLGKTQLYEVSPKAFEAEAKVEIPAEFEAIMDEGTQNPEIRAMAEEEARNLQAMRNAIRMTAIAEQAIHKGQQALLRGGLNDLEEARIEFSKASAAYHTISGLGLPAIVLRTGILQRFGGTEAMEGQLYADRLGTVARNLIEVSKGLQGFETNPTQVTQQVNDLLERTLDLLKAKPGENEALRQSVYELSEVAKFFLQRLNSAAGEANAREAFLKSVYLKEQLSLFKERIKDSPLENHPLIQQIENVHNQLDAQAWERYKTSVVSDQISEGDKAFKPKEI